MKFFRRLRIPELIELCSSMRYALESGFMLRDVMDLLAKQGTRRVRLFALEIGKEIKSGWSLPDALAKQKKVLPPLFVSLATVGEESGTLPTVLAELEKYYILQKKLRREFQEQIAWPVLQLVAAVLIISTLIYIQDFLPKTRGPEGDQPMDALGLGLVGEEGAMIFLAC